MHLAAIHVTGDRAELKLSVNGQRGFGTWLAIGADGMRGQQLTDGSPARSIVYEEDSPILQPVRLIENVEYEFTIKLMASATHISEAVHALAPFRTDALLGVATLNSPDSWHVNGEWITLTGRLNFKYRAGHADLSIELNGCRLTLAVDVLPAKLDLEEHFHNILDDLARHHVELLLRLDTGVEVTLELIEESSGGSIEEMIHLRRLFDSGEIADAIQRIEANTTSALHEFELREPTEVCTDPDWDSFSRSPFESDWVSLSRGDSDESRWLPSTLPTARKVFRPDSKENRFIKHLIQQLSFRVEAIREALPLSHTASHYALRRWQASLDQILSKSFWTQIPARATVPNSMALLQRAGYRDFIRAMAEISMATKLAGHYSMTDKGGELKPIHDLYETWCFFAFCRAITVLTGVNVTDQVQLSKNSNDPLSMAASIRHQPLHASFLWGGQLIELTIYSNRHFRRTGGDGWEGSYSVRLRPDISLQIELNGQSHWLHFDSKYRLDAAQLDEAWRSELLIDTVADSFVQQDIHVIHTYRDALLGTRGSYIFYPGRETKPRFFPRHGLSDYRASERLPGVGAFPLLPSSSGDASQTGELVAFLLSAVDRLVQASDYQEESGFT